MGILDQYVKFENYGTTSRAIRTVQFMKANQDEIVQRSRLRVEASVSRRIKTDGLVWFWLQCHKYTESMLNIMSGRRLDIPKRWINE